MLSIAGSDIFTASYNDEARPDGSNTAVKASAALFSAATLAITGSEYLEPAEIVHVGKKIFLELEDPDRDI